MKLNQKNNIILSTKNLAIGYKTKRKKNILVSDISVDLEIGQLIGLVGANGVGKSTFLRTLSRVQPALSGSIIINSFNINKISSIDLAKELSVVLTETLYSKNLTVYELVALGRQPYTNWVGQIKDTDAFKINLALTITNIQHLKYQRCYELSDGQLQKVMIARALAQDTHLIVLDEPTTHLDLYHKASTIKLLRKLTKETGKTILFSTHDIDLAIQLCDAIMVIQNKKIIYKKPSQLIAEGVFNNLFHNKLINFDAETGTFKVTK